MEATYTADVCNDARGLVSYAKVECVVRALHGEAAGHAVSFGLFREIAEQVCLRHQLAEAPVARVWYIAEITESLVVDLKAGTGAIKE